MKTELRDRAHTVLRVLDQAKIPVEMAAWVPDDDDNWYLQLYTPMLDRLGPSRSYKRLQSALRGFTDTVPLSKTRLKSPSAPEFKAMIHAVSVGQFGDAEIQRSNFDGVYIAHMILVRSPL